MKSMPTIAVPEPSEEYLESLLATSRGVAQKLLELGFDRRARVLHSVGKLWREKLESGELDELVRELTKSTGYSVKNIELDLYFVSEVLNEESLRGLFESSLVGGYRSIDSPVEVAPGEFIWNRPMGTVFIIASGNSVVPPVLAASTSILAGNLTILRPSQTNLVAVNKVFELISELASTGSFEAGVMGEAAKVLYMSHDSPTLRYLLEEAPVSVVNYWGGEPGRSRVLSMTVRNPHRPRVVINGPLTGVAIVDEESADLETARRLARDVVLYDQQLCSSPTFLLFVGARKPFLEFTKRLAKALDEVGSKFPIELGEGSFYRLHTLRKSLELKGVDVFYSRSAQNPWTLVVSKLDDAGAVTTEWGAYSRRVLEVIQVENLEGLSRGLEYVLNKLRKIGIDGIQTASYSVSKDRLASILGILSKYGVYRVVPAGESFLRTPAEPYDGEFIAKYYTYTVYIRVKDKIGELVARGAGIP
ncbi:MAG: aldehyde dehydrogenase family protein [Sulfolobales archaeon]